MKAGSSSGETDHLYVKYDLCIAMAVQHSANKKHINSLQGNYANVCKLLSRVIIEEQNKYKNTSKVNQFWQFLIYLWTMLSLTIYRQVYITYNK